MTRPIEYLDVEITTPPKAWPRTRGGHHNPADYRAWKSEVADKLGAMAGYRKFAGEVSVSIDFRRNGFTVRIAALDEGDDRRQGTGLGGDIDNYAKAVLDAAQAAGILTDDRQVAQIAARFRPDRSAE